MPAAKPSKCSRLPPHESARLPLEPLTTEASDTVDAGLTPRPPLRDAGRPLFPAHCRAASPFHHATLPFQPAAFSRRVYPGNLILKSPPGALPVDGDFYTVATEAFNRALETLRRQPGLIFDHPDTGRRVQTWRDLKATEAQLAELNEFAGS